MKNKLSPRQESILNRVVDTHIHTAQPVGSHLITALYRELYRSSYSPATVRHEMGCLEEMGYLTHPHTSAGRIPTDLGYRYYVDYSLQEESLEEELIRKVESELKRFAAESDALAERASSILSNLTGEVSVFIQSASREPGKVSHKLFRVCVQGSSRILEKPEFQNVGKVHDLLKALEEKDSLAEWLSESTAPSGVSVTIGCENRPEVFQACSFISARYSRASGFSGTVAVLGPRRMKYSRAVPMVAQIARMVARILDGEEAS